MLLVLVLQCSERKVHSLLTGRLGASGCATHVLYLLTQPFCTAVSPSEEVRLSLYVNLSMHVRFTCGSDLLVQVLTHALH